jgi:hypothetical protein
VKRYAQQPAALLFANDDSIRLPVGLRLSADGNRLYVANAGNRQLNVYDVASRASVNSLPLSFAPTRLNAFGTPSVFLMNDIVQGKTPVYVLSDGASKQAVYFVPNPANAAAHPALRYHPTAGAH